VEEIIKRHFGDRMDRPCHPWPYREEKDGYQENSRENNP